MNGNDLQNTGMPPNNGNKPPQSATVMPGQNGNGGRH
jgi:hypothetical protein